MLLAVKMIDEEQEFHSAVRQNSITKRADALSFIASQSNKVTPRKFLSYPVKIDRTDDHLTNTSLHKFNRELEELRHQVETLKEMNKKLLSERETPDQFSRDDLHSMYQLLFIEDYKAEVIAIESEMMHFCNVSE